MNPRTARVHLTPGDGTVEVDGHELTGITAVNISGNTNDAPRLTLDVRLHEIDIDGEMTVDLPESTCDTLTSLGWTPPEETEALRQLAQAMRIHLEPDDVLVFSNVDIDPGQAKPVFDRIKEVLGGRTIVFFPGPVELDLLRDLEEKQ